MKVIKDLYLFMMIRDILNMMEYIRYHMDIKIYQQEIDKIKNIYIFINS